MDYSHDEVEQELIRRGALPPNAPSFSQQEIEDELKRRGVNPSPNSIDTFLGAMEKPTSDMFSPDETMINQMTLMAMPEGRIISPLLKTARNIPFVEKLAGMIDQSHPFARGILKSLGAGTEGAITGAAAFPLDKTAGALAGLAFGGVGYPLFKGGQWAFNALRPSNLFRGNATPEQMARNVEAAQGVPVGLGNIVENPLMKAGIENLAAKLPFSGAHQKLAETGQAIKNQAEDIVSNYLPENIPPSEVSEKLGEALINAKNQAEKTKRNAYKSANNMAEKEGLQLTLPRFSKSANKYVQSIENTTMLQYEPETKALIQRLKNYKNPVKSSSSEGLIVDKEGNPIINETNVKYPSLEEANTLAGRLNELSRKFKSSVDSTQRGAGTILGKLGSALKTDIKRSIDKSGSSELKEEFENAEKNYAENYHPFLDKDLLQFTENNRPPEDIVATFLQNSKKSDRVTQLSKLLDRLNEDQKDLVRYSYFSRALEGEEDAKTVNPNKLKTLWSSLGDNQKRTLIPNKAERQKFDNFSNLTGSNQAALSLMSNPITGHQLSVKYLLKAPFGIAARPFVNKLTSEEYRNKIVKQIMESYQKENKA